MRLQKRFTVLSSQFLVLSSQFLVIPFVEICLQIFFRGAAGRIVEKGYFGLFSAVSRVPPSPLTLRRACWALGLQKGVGKI